MSVETGNIGGKTKYLEDFGRFSIKLFKYVDRIEKLFIDGSVTSKNDPTTESSPPSRRA